MGNNLLRNATSHFNLDNVIKHIQEKYLIWIIMQIL